MHAQLDLVAIMLCDVSFLIFLGLHPSSLTARPSLPGPNTRKRQAALDLIKQYYHVRPDELFRRIKATTLVTLMVEVARLQQEVGAAPPPPSSPPDGATAVKHTHPHDLQR